MPYLQFISDTVVKELFFAQCFSKYFSFVSCVMQNFIIHLVIFKNISKRASAQNGLWCIYLAFLSLFHKGIGDTLEGESNSLWKSLRVFPSLLLPCSWFLFMFSVCWLFHLSTLAMLPTSTLCTIFLTS